MTPPRMSFWLLVTLVLVATVILTSPPPGDFQVQLWRVGLHKLSLVAAAAWLGYWIDRGLFPYARPDALMPHDDPDIIEAMDEHGDMLSAELVSLNYSFEAAMIRRAIIVGACIVGVALGA